MSPSGDADNESSEENESEPKRQKQSEGVEAGCAVAPTTGLFRPKRNTQECMQGIERLRACSFNGPTNGSSQDHEENSEDKMPSLKRLRELMASH